MKFSPEDRYWCLLKSDLLHEKVFLLQALHNLTVEQPGQESSGQAEEEEEEL